MSESAAKPVPVDESLARAIFTAAAAAGIAQRDFTVDYKAMAELSFEAAKAYAKTQQENKRPPINFSAGLGS